MNNTTIKELKELNRLICSCPNSLDTVLDAIEKDNNNHNNKKLTKENFEYFVNRIRYSNNKLDIQDFLFITISKIKDIFGNIIKENFPFYTNYDISFSMCHGITTAIISISYYYMGKKEYHDDIISLNSKYLEKNIQYFESVLTDIKKDIISYPNNETQQKFLREY